VSAAAAIARQTFRDGRVRTFSFAALFALVALIQVVGYEHSYPTVAERAEFAHSFGANKAIRLFYGVPHDLLHVGGYVAWRVGGILSIFAAAWGVFAAVRALRTEEDSGRTELVLAAPVGRGTAFRAELTAIAAGAALLALALWVGLVVGGLAAGPSAYLALEALSMAGVFAAVGALTSQLAPTRRLALGLGLAVLAVALILRIVADTAGSLESLRWASPLGWAEELRPFAGPRPAVLVLPAATAVILLFAAARIQRRRDVGTGVLASDDSAAPRLGLLSSPTALALREERGSLIAWLAGIALYAIVVGVLADTFNAENLSEPLREQLRKLGGASLVTPAGAVSFYFLMFAFAFSLFVGAQISAARHEEAESRLETLFAQPHSRRAWLGGRLALAAASALGLALAASILAWVGAASQGAGVSLSELLEAGLNCTPVTVLFLGISALAFALAPRATAAIAYGLASVAFCWYLFGAIAGLPSWTLDLTPFNHIGLVPAHPIDWTAALTMLGCGIAACLAAVWAFERRDILGA
jgi:ABC-2 type transport system permease protein